MLYVLLALGVYKAVQLLRDVIEPPDHLQSIFHILLATGISAAALWVAGLNPAWSPAVAALAGFAHRLDGLFQATTDWVRVTVLRSRGRR